MYTYFICTDLTVVWVIPVTLGPDLVVMTALPVRLRWPGMDQDRSCSSIRKDNFFPHTTAQLFIYQ